MKKYQAQTFLLSVVMLLLVGCATNIPISSNVDEQVYSDVKTNSSSSVKVNYSSLIVDGEIKPYTKDKVKTVPAHPGYIHTQSTTFGKMVNEYMGNKFSKLNDAGDTTIRVTLKEFWIEQYPIGTTIVFGGAETDSVITVNVQIEVDVISAGEEKTKVINATSEDQFLPKKITTSSTRNGVTTSETYSDPNGPNLQVSHAKNINKANNKALMLLNAYLNEISL